MTARLAESPMTCVATGGAGVGEFDASTCRGGVEGAEAVLTKA